MSINKQNLSTLTIMVFCLEIISKLYNLGYIEYYITLAIISFITPPVFERKNGK